MSRSISACLGLKKQRWERRWDYKRGRRSLLGPRGIFTELICESVSEMWNESESVSLTQSCLTLCNPADCSPAGSSVHGIFQARTLEWVAIPFSRGSSQPRDWTQAFNITGIFFTSWATREALTRYTWNLNKRGYKRTYLQNRNRVTDKKLNYGYWKVRGER